MQVLQTITSAFRGRKVTLAQLQAKIQTKNNANSVNRWEIYKQLCIAKTIFGINDRCLAVLSSLLSFYPDNEISLKNGLVVFPSNRQLALRAHGMPESTLRRHLCTLVQVGLIARRDSPNGKRYSYKNREGQIEEAFGFSFAPLLDRAAEIAKTAEQIQADTLRLKRIREQITLLRRETAQIIEVALTEAPTPQWNSFHVEFRSMVDALPRRATIEELQSILAKFTAFHQNMNKRLNSCNVSQEMSANRDQNERHYNEFLTEYSFESLNLEKGNLKKEIIPAIPNSVFRKNNTTNLSQSLELVLKACPDIQHYAVNNIASWRNLYDTTEIVSQFLAITQSAYKEAIQAMGLHQTSIVIACLLQRLSEIKSAGGYLRSLTQKAKVGCFSIDQMLMTSLNDAI